MKLAINATFNPSGGSKTQLVNMLKYFYQAKDIEIVIYIKRNNLSLVQDINQSNVKVIISKFAGINTGTRVIWEQTILPFLLLKNKIDVLFCPGNIAPIFSPVKTIQWIGTIGPFCHDFYKYFTFSNRLRLFINKHIMILSAKRSDIVIHESEFSRNLFITKYGSDKRKTEVIHIGKDIFFYPDNTVDAQKKVLKNRNFTEPFVLCVSHLYPYKNISRMIKAFDIARKNTNSDLKLVIAGDIRSDKYYNLLLSTIEKFYLEESIIFLGLVSKQELLYLYSSCLFFIFPSPYESIGYTLIEAMTCGAAITCSNTTAIPETCKDAALYFDPNSSRYMSEKIEILINNKKLRELLSKKSLDRVKELPDYDDVTDKVLNMVKRLAYNPN